MKLLRSAPAVALWLAAPLGVAGPLPTASHPPPPVATRPMSDLKIAATIPIGKTADWVAVTSDSVWVGSTGPYAVSEIDPHTNRTTRVELPGEPCAGLAVDTDSLWAPLCGEKGAKSRLAKVDLKTHTLARVFDVRACRSGGGDCGRCR